MANFNINEAGFFIVGLFVVTWVVALTVWRFGRIEHRWEAAAAEGRSTERRSAYGVPPARVRPISYGVPSPSTATSWVPARSR